MNLARTGEAQGMTLSRTGGARGRWRSAIAPVVLLRAGLLVCGPALVSLPTASAAPIAAPAQRFYLVLGAVQNADGTDRGDAVAGDARRLLREALAREPDVLLADESLDVKGLADPAQVGALAESLKRRRLQGLLVTLRLLKAERTMAPPLPGKRYQIMEQRVRLALVGTTLPGAQLLLGGEGESTLQAEVGARVTPQQEQELTRDALKDAVAQAVTQALRQLRQRTEAKPPKKR